MRRSSPWGAMLLLLVAGCGAPLPESAGPPIDERSEGVVVTPGALGGWVVDLTGATAAARFVAGPGGPPAGAGSLELTTGADGDGGPQLRNAGFAGRPLASLTELSYWTRITQNVNCQAPYLVLTVDTDGNGQADDRLFFEPCYQTGRYIGEPVPDQGEVQRGAWQRWDALRGGWWPASGGTPGPPLVTIASYLAAHPGATIVNAADGRGGVRLGAGFGAPIWNDFVGHADALTIGFDGRSTTYDFEPAAGPTTCTPTGAPVLNVSQRVRNDVDSGAAGNYWAYDSYRKIIQVWAAGPGTYCAIVRYTGSFVTVAGASPGGTGTIRAGIPGSFAGVYSATIRGALNPAPGVPTSGDLGVADYRCDAATGACPGRFDWVQTYFNPGAGFAFDWWIWVYLTVGHGAWVNASGGNLGDIHD